MNFITTGAFSDRATPTRAASPQARQNHRDRPQQPYAFLSVRDLRGLVAAMVD